jgi:uncharacterized protein YjiS (DUF1127 family)
MTSATEQCLPHPRKALSDSWTRRLLALVPQLVRRRTFRLDLDQLPPHLLRDLGLGDPACRDDPWLR